MSRLSRLKRSIKQKIKRGIWRNFKRYARLYLEMRILRYGIRAIRKKVGKKLPDR